MAKHPSFATAVVSVLLLQATASGQGSKLAGTGAIGNARQGSAVAISADGSTIAIGGPADNNGMGAVWIFNREQPEAKLVGTDGIDSPALGWSVAISGDGNTVAAGGPNDAGGIGAAWVFVRNGGVWEQQAKLVGSGAVRNPRQGTVALSADGDTLLIGGPEDGGVGGAVWVFTRSNGVWFQQGSKLTASGAHLGTAVSVSGDGNTAIAGAMGFDLTLGAAWIFTRANGVWTQQGSRLSGSPASTLDGASVAISQDGNTALVGSWFAGATAYHRDGGVWTQQGPPLAGAGTAGDRFASQGASVALAADGNTALIGGPRSSEDDGPLVGAAWLFGRTSGNWVQIGDKLAGSSADAQQGTSVALSADARSALVGGPGDNGGAGAAWLFTIAHKAVPSITSSSSAKLTAYSTPPTFTVLVAGEAGGVVPAGTISLGIDDAARSATATLIDGAATLTASVPPGVHTIHFAYSGDANYSAVTGGVLSQSINHGPTSTTLTAAPSYSTGMLRLSARVVGLADPNSRISGGTVTFRDSNGNVLGRFFTTGGEARCDVPLASLATPGAIYRFTAAYDGSGDANSTYDPSPTSGPATFTVAQNAVTVTLSSSANPAVFGEPITITARVATVGGGAKPTGVVGFTDLSTGRSSLTRDGVPVPLNAAGEARMGVPFDPGGVLRDSNLLLGGGTHAIRATYYGDANYSPAPSVPFSQQILRAETTTTLLNGYGFDGRSMLTALVSPVAEFPGARVVLDANGKSQYGYPDGSVQFWKGAASIGTANLPQSGPRSVASLATSTPLGNMRAVYAGDSNYNGSADPSPALPLPTPGAVTLTADPLSPNALEPVTFIASVDSPSGGVQFFDGRAQLGKAPVVRGQARFTTLLRAGTHAISAAFDGNADYPAPSATIGVYVTQLPPR